MQYCGCLVATPFREYHDTHQRLRSVSASDIIMVLQINTTRVGAYRLIFAPEDGRMHSLRSSGSMAMYIAGVLGCNIVAIVWWHSLGYMVKSVCSARDSG